MGRVRKYQISWEKEIWAQGWLRENKAMPNYNAHDINEAYCLYCHVSLRAHAADLKRHATLKKHVVKANAVVSVKKKCLTNFVKPTTDKKIAELELAIYVCFHSSIRSVDHLNTFLKKHGKGSTLENIKVHRTKCGCLIKNVISKALLAQILRDVGNQKYSLLVDESTDVAINKYMAVCIRYFSEPHQQVVTDFLGLILIERATAVDLYESLKCFLEKLKLPIRNLMALGTDGANNLCGCNHSLYTLLKDDVPDLKLLKCSCHSIHLSVSKAADKLPTALEFVAREVYNWFSQSTLRRIEYKKMFDLINLGENKNFNNFVQLSATRWLARYNVVKRILENWLELKSFFSMLNVRCYVANTLKDMLNDEKNLLYFTFLKPILADMQELNLVFQSETYDIGSAYYSLFLSIESLAKRIIKPLFLNYPNKTNLLKNVIDCVYNNLAYLSLECVDLGYDFMTLLSKSNVNEQEIKTRCFEFLKCLLQELVERLPSNFDIYSKIKLLHPSNCLQTTNRPEFQNLPVMSVLLPNENKDSLENQWRKLTSVNWTDEFGGKLPNNTTEFWLKVYFYCDGSAKHFFKELAVVVLRILCLPISNAMVERVFSVMNLVKTKIRNRMLLKMLEAIMRVRVFIKNRNYCCENFEITQEMLNLFTSDMYNDNNEDGTDDLVSALEMTADSF